MSLFKLKECTYGVKQVMLPLCIASCTTVAAVNTVQAESIAEAFTSSTVKTSFRLRFEDAEVGTLEASDALTLKTRLTLQTGEFSSTSMLLEFDDTTALTEVDYTDGATEIVGTTPIADPQLTEVNQAYLSYKGIGKTDVKYGRQRILLDNQRFVGGVGFRQNEQTYDAFSVSAKPSDSLNVFYAYVTRVNKIFGEASGLLPGYFDSKSHLLNVSYSGIPLIGKATGYAYMLDLLTPAGGASNSSDTLGFRLSNSFDGDIPMGYAFEYAMQSDAADNPTEYDANYMLLEGNATLATVKFTVGYELLGSDEGNASFYTPLATLHKFQGWTDNFLGMKAEGVVDTYISATSTVAGLKLVGVFHTLSKDEGDGDYGTEFGLVVAKNFNENYGLSLKYADFSADDGSSTPDATKLWLTAAANF